MVGALKVRNTHGVEFEVGSGLNDDMHTVITKDRYCDHLQVPVVQRKEWQTSLPNILAHLPATVIIQVCCRKHSFRIPETLPAGSPVAERSACRVATFRLFVWRIVGSRSSVD